MWDLCDAKTLPVSNTLLALLHIWEVIGNLTYFFPLIIFSSAAHCCFCSVIFSLVWRFLMASRSFCCLRPVFTKPFSWRRDSTVIGSNTSGGSKRVKANRYNFLGKVSNITKLPTEFNEISTKSWSIETIITYNNM